jgi:hypothetical protein
MPQTVTQCLTAATDSVTLIDNINTNGAAFQVVPDITQAEINDIVQRNVNHLETILAYDGTNDLPDIAGYSGDKSSYTGAITTGNAYIAAN